MNNINIFDVSKLKKIDESVIKGLDSYFIKLENQYNDELLKGIDERDEKYRQMNNKFGGEDLYKMKQSSHNKRLEEFVLSSGDEVRIINYNNEFIQQKDMIFFVEGKKENPVNYRTHFLSPKKHFLFGRFDTYWFNLFIIWFTILILSITLYFDTLKKIISIDFRRSR